MSLHLAERLTAYVWRISKHGIETTCFHDLGKAMATRPIEDVDAVTFVFIEKIHFRLLVKVRFDE